MFRGGNDRLGGTRSSTKDTSKLAGNMMVLSDLYLVSPSYQVISACSVLAQILPLMM